MSKFVNSFVFNEKSYHYYDLKRVFEKYPILRKLPNSLKILLETNIRNVNESEYNYILETFLKRDNLRKIGFFPNRVVINDNFGISILKEFLPLKEKYQNINPTITTDLIVIDNKDEKEKSNILKLALSKFENFSVISSNNQDFALINLEYLSTMLYSRQKDNDIFLFPETLVGTDTQVSMTNSIGILGIKLNEIDIKSAILGSPIILEFPSVVGIELFGNITLGVSISDIVNALIEILKISDIKNKIVEFYGIGLKNISIEDRVTLSNAIIEFGAVCGYFGMDENTLSYVEKTRGVDATLIKEYFIKQGMYDNQDLTYDEYIRFNLSTIKPSIVYKKGFERIEVKDVPLKLDSFKKGRVVKDNDILIATISSNSSLTLLIEACLVAKKACELDVKINKNIKIFFELNSLQIKEYLEKLDLLKYFEYLGIKIVIESSKELTTELILDIEEFNLNVISISSLDENNTNSKIKSSWIMSPALVLAYSLKGNINFDITKDTIYQDICLSDIWPSTNEVNNKLLSIDSFCYQNKYKDIYMKKETIENLKDISFDKKVLDMSEEKEEEYININEAKILAIFDEEITTKDIVPYGEITPYTQVGFYLESIGLKPDQFGTYEKRYDDVEVLKRGLFSTSKIKNKIVFPKEGGYTKDFENKEIVTIYEYTQKMKNQNKPLVILSNKKFATSYNNLQAIKGLKLLGVKAIVAQSFEKNYKEDLIKVGILPLELMEDDLKELKGDELITIKTTDLKINSKFDIEIKKADEVKYLKVLSRLDNKLELLYFKYGGILNYLIKKQLGKI
ncbi:MAG: aconitase family protein [Arcobacter sp.]|uniref:aconitase family protein n=1 Tax=Arcobacter sp. TaxID=1872629 RepID=UPI00259090C3|nr:aconitase family protein [Arcobacter sp.]MDD3007906.1 aconitase family protein [Arcobacter sp.]MDY3204825.1 aconitase family protein [Arcobacter sp.]